MIDLRRREGRVLRIGHRGAAGLAAENTLESLLRATEHGVDLVEVDVLATGDGELILAHSDDLWDVSHGAARGRIGRRSVAELRELAPSLPTLDDALELLDERAPELGIQLDLKRPGYEAAVVDALRRHGALERSFVSSFHRSSLRVMATLEPALPRAVTYPQDRYGISRRWALRPVMLGGLIALRGVLPRRIGAWLQSTGAAAATLHWSLISRTAVTRCHELGAAVLAWTVDDPLVARRLIGAGIDGIITNDPRIFDGDPP